MAARGGTLLLLLRRHPSDPNGSTSWHVFETTLPQIGQKRHRATSKQQQQQEQQQEQREQYQKWTAQLNYVLMNLKGPTNIIHDKRLSVLANREIR